MATAGVAGGGLEHQPGGGLGGLEMQYWMVGLVSSWLEFIGCHGLLTSSLPDTLADERHASAARIQDTTGQGGSHAG
jgi:hypothetical protein